MQKKNPAFASKFIGQGFLLFLDQILVAATNAFYWIVVSKLTSTSEIGQATLVYSLVLLMGTVYQLGLEYPLLKKSLQTRSRVLGAVLTIELLLISSMVPFMIFFAHSNIYHDALSRFMWVAVGLLIFSPLTFVARFALLGISDAKNVFIFDIVATALKFVVVYIVLSMGVGAFGILFSFMIGNIVSASAMLMLASRRVSLKLVHDKAELTEVLKEGLSNLPSKVSRTLIITLSVILLASFGINDSEVGVFYIAMMISIVGAGLASSLSFTVIPASAESKVDLSSGSLRLGLSLTSPIVAALIVGPEHVLNLIGSQYAGAGPVLLVLSIAIVPNAIVGNAIARLNYLDQRRKIILLGVMQLVGFLFCFFVLVPPFGILGAAYAILLSYAISALLGLFWFEGPRKKIVSKSLVAIIAGITIGYAVNMWLNSELAAIICAIITTLTVIIAVRNLSISELRFLAKKITSRSAKTTSL